MRIEQLQYLVKVVETKSFTAAGDKLHIAQPSISQAIAALERELGVTILTRTRSGASVTKEGIEIVEHARRICEEVELIQSIASGTKKQNDSVTIVSTPTINSVILARCIIELNKKNSKIQRNEFHILQNVSKIAEQLVGSDEADFALIPVLSNAPVMNDPNYTFTHLMDSDIMAIVRRDSPLADIKLLTFRAIQKRPVILFSNQYVTYNLLYSRISEYGSPNIVFESGNPDLTREMAREYDNIVGFAYDINIFQPSNTAFFENSNDIVMIPIEKPVVVPIGILKKKNRRLPPLAHDLITMLETRCSDLQKDLNIYHQRSN